jgi:hypothetical protein
LEKRPAKLLKEIILDQNKSELYVKVIENDETCIPIIVKKFEDEISKYPIPGVKNMKFPIKDHWNNKESPIYNIQKELFLEFSWLSSAAITICCSQQEIQSKVMSSFSM